MYSEIKEVYDALWDRESQYIFRQRMLYSLSNDWMDIKDMLFFLYDIKVPHALNLLDVFVRPEIFRDKKIAFFGLGGWSGSAKHLLACAGLAASIYCDNDRNKIGTEMDGILVISPEELAERHKDAMVIVTTEMYEKEVIAQLLSLGFPECQIVRLRFHDRETYFDLEILPAPQENGIFIDGGCYDGKSSQDFITWSKGRAKKIYAFEPDEMHYSVCKKFFEERCSIPYRLEKAGLYSKSATLTFSNEHSAGARFTDEGSVKVAAVALDDVVAIEDRVTFVKLDIEGAEYEALNGMERMLRRCQPIVAVCLYHKPQDIWEIPGYVHHILPEHRLYIRHYTPSALDTVLYAVPV